MSGLKWKLRSSQTVRSGTTLSQRRPAVISPNRTSGPKLAPLREVGSEALCIGVVDDAGQLCAAMVLVIARVPVLHRTFFYAPRGPVIEDPDSPAMTILLNFVRAEAHKRHAFMLKVEPSVLDGDTRWQLALKQRGFQINPYAAHIRHEWVLDIRPDEKTLQAQMKEKWRYNIRLATRKGITVRRGESQADLDTFYRLYETTSERDQFVIQNKAYYIELMRLYTESKHAALFLAEYEGQTIAGTIIATLGHWSWYMFGASSNEHRERMPNHLLQWTSMQWAREQGCWYYNFRGIPDILEEPVIKRPETTLARLAFGSFVGKEVASGSSGRKESQELWGVYLFKRGFGGYPLRFLETHDLVYQPLIYETYRRLLDVKRWRDERRYKKATELSLSPAKH